MPEKPVWTSWFSLTVRMDPARTLRDYWRAPSDGPLHDIWEDKPTRLLYDLVGEVEHLRAESNGRLKVLTEKAAELRTALIKIDRLEAEIAVLRLK